MAHGFSFESILELRLPQFLIFSKVVSDQQLQQARLNLLVQRGALADAEGYKKVLSLLGG